MLSKAKRQFLQHLHVLATANKYQVQELKELAYDRIEQLLELYVATHTPDCHELDAPSFFRFVIEQSYLHSEEHFPTELTSALPTAFIWGDESESEDGHNPAPGLCSPTSSSAALIWGDELGPNDGEQSTFDVPVEDVDAGETDVSFYGLFATDKPTTEHPIERIQALILQVALTPWRYADSSADFNCFHLRVLARKVPDFGTDLSITALEFGPLNGPPHLRYGTVA